MQDDDDPHAPRLPPQLPLHSNASSTITCGSSLPADTTKHTTRRAGSTRKVSFNKEDHDSHGSFKGMRKWQSHAGPPPMDRLKSLGTSFKHQVEEYKVPSLGRLASTWDVPTVFPDAGISLPQVHLDVESSEAKALCVPGTKGHKLLILCACTVSFGPSFARAILSAVSADIMNDFNMTKATYGALSGLPAIPNIFASPIGGAMVDKFGADKCCVIYAALVVLGSAFLSLAVPWESVALLAAGQVLMGIGRGTLTTAQMVFLKLASDPGEISFFFALSFSMTHCGVFMAFFLSPLIMTTSPFGYQACVWASTGITLFSFLCTLPLLGKLRHIMPLLHKQLEEESDEEEEGAEEEDGEQALGGREEEGEGGVELLPLATLVRREDLKGGEGCKVGRYSFPREDDDAAPPPSCGHALYIYFEDLLTLPFLLLLLSICCYYLAFVPFETFAVDFLKTDLAFKPSTASLGASLVPLCAVFLGPFFGARVDIELWKRGEPGRWTQRLCPPGATQAWAMLLTAVGMSVTALAPVHWAWGFGLVSFAYAMACAALWSLVPELVAGPSLGLALGVISAINNLVIMVLDVLIGRLLDEGKTYKQIVWPMLVGFAVLGLLTTLPLMKLLAGKVRSDMSR